jgi:hypothetical protein
MPVREPEIQETGPDGIITEVALGLIAVRHDHWYPSGTAVVIAPHLGVTARHVIDDYWRRFGDDRKLKFGDLEASFGLLAQQVLPGGSGALWAVRKLWRSPHTDLAVLLLDPYSELARTYRWRRPMLRLRPPAVGDDVSCFGYRGGAARAAVDSEQIKVKWTCSPSTAVGRVVEVFGNRRDRGMLDFPCFSTNAPFTHGMSGGPIMLNGVLSGIICAGGLEGADGQQMTYGVSLWPLLATTLPLDVAGYPKGAEFTVLDLVQRGFVRAVDLESISVESADDGRLSIHGPYMS